MNHRNQVKNLISSKLKELTSVLKVDFSAIAFYDAFNQEFRYRLAEGSLNHRYMNIVVRNNKGVCGKVLQTKKEYVVRNYPEGFENDALEYPILIIEELKSALAIPMIFQTQFFGILLIGQRTPRDFQQLEIDFMQKTAMEILDIFFLEQQVDKLNEDERPSVADTPLYRYFAKEKERRGDKLEVILLDQRITLLSQDSKKELISIFDYLLEWTFSGSEETEVKVIIEFKSEQQFIVQLEIDKSVEFPDAVFSQFASKVGKMDGSIEMEYGSDRTLITMNFLMTSLLYDRFDQ